MKNDLEVYLFYRDQFRTGDMIAWKSNSTIGKLIRWRTVPRSVPEDSHLNVNHTSGIIRLKEYEGEARRVFVTESLEAGTVLNLLSRRLEKFDGHVWWYPLKDGWNSKRRKIGETALEYIGIKYDYKSIMEMITGSVSVDVKKFFCTEYYYHQLGFKGKAPNPYQICCMEFFQLPVRII